VDAIARYYPLNWTNLAYHCPGYKGLYTNTLPNGGLGTIAYYVGSYGYNSYGTGVGPTDDELLGLGPEFLTQPTPDLPLPPAILESMVRSPSEMVAFADSQTYLGAGIGSGDGEAFLMVPPYGPTGWMDPRCYPPRHGNNYNAACCDGHVEGMRPSLLLSPWANAIRWNNDHLPHPETWP
jgi:prepilin-type processing-associated H-X9-DG protein